MGDVDRSSPEESTRQSGTDESGSVVSGADGSSTDTGSADIGSTGTSGNDASRGSDSGDAEGPSAAERTNPSQSRVTTADAGEGARTRDVATEADGVRLRYGSATDVGLVRSVNEDASLAEPPVFVVADGMGGHEGGDIASAIVVEEFARLAAGAYPAARGAETVAEVLGVCRQRINDFAARRRLEIQDPFAYAGTTAVVALVVEDEGELKWLLANIGDSRIYRLHEGTLEQVSVDHSLVQELHDAGRITAEQMAVHPERNVITRSVGGPEESIADFFLLPWPAAERLMLCSDGVTGMIGDARITELLRDTADPQEAALALVGAAVAAGGKDNATAVVIDVVGLGPKDSYDSATQRESLEQKLGALP